MAEEKKPFHERVAEKIIDQLKAGTAPWQRPWNPAAPGAEGGSIIPMNPTTGKRYRGVNVVNLMSEGHDDNRWMTYKQAAAAGAQVRKGEKGSLVQYWKFDDEQTLKDAQGKPIKDAEGNTVKVRVELERPRPFYAVVFNAEQIEGLPPRTPPVPPEWNPIDRAEAILQASGAKITELPGNRAFYSPATDSITLPERSQFPSADRFYGTALHEVGHWTGAPNRLDRDLAHPFGSEGYAKEELRAEIASMLLGDELQIGHDPEQHVAYVASWIKALEDDPMEIVRACSDAEKINTFILAFEQKQIQEIDGQAVPAGELEAPALTAEAELADRPAIVGQPAEQDTPINVAFREKNEAKGLGAKWDKEARTWLVPAGIDLTPFAKWAKDTPAPAVERPSQQAAPAEPQRAETPAAAPSVEQEGQPMTNRSDKPQQTPERKYLAVPYGERHVAKAAGAKWDAAAKSWYVGEGSDPVKLARWDPDQVAHRQEAAVSPEVEFAAAMKAMGLTVPAGHPIMDGTRQRVPTVDDKGKETSGFYIAYLDGHPAGHIKNFKSSLDMNWKSTGNALSEEEKARLNAEAATKRDAREREQAATYEETAGRVQRRAAGYQQIETPTLYMVRKGIEPTIGAMMDGRDSTIHLPAIDAQGKHWTTQYIQDDGTKRYAKDSHKEGCFHVVNGGRTPEEALAALEAAPRLMIGEGYATMTTIASVVEHPTVSAFDSGNLPAVAKALHERFPDKPIFIVGEDDQRVLERHGYNPGREKATEAANAVGGKPMFPTFAPGEQAADPKRFTDFNDLAVNSSLGREGLERQVKAAVENPRAQALTGPRLSVDEETQQKRRSGPAIGDDQPAQRRGARI
ncbi:zincin-like metallopeptidase domain-containing protein [Sphingomonas sp. PAMC 26605]|uniref:zincin-like metallopeptidase domain-containing protein n=1 Tax=Sphingomonas sp. PAMC 26605 TaxID=1112214 RepID=UPI00026CAD09|nr:zincin-like metallopeptidase domain-containing protein [Sphingomonas sp. PAMC 26605]